MYLNASITKMKFALFSFRWMLSGAHYDPTLCTITCLENLLSQRGLLRCQVGCEVYPLCVIIRCDLQRSFSLGSAISFVYWIASCSQSLRNVYYKYGEFIVMIRIRISYQSLGSSHIIGTDQSTLEKDSSYNLMSHDPSDLGSLIPFRIIFLRNALLNFLCQVLSLVVLFECVGHFHGLTSSTFKPWFSDGPPSILWRRFPLLARTTYERLPV